MRKNAILIILLMICYNLKAQQFKLSLLQGLGYDANIAQDSLFFAKNYTTTQLRIGYHVGKLGLIGNVTNIHQKSISENAVEDKRIPKHLLQHEKSFSNVNTIISSLGLELCVPVYKRKAQLNAYATYGFSISKGDAVSFSKLSEISYSNKANGKSASCYQIGASINYKLNQHVAVKWQNEFDAYKIRFDGFDVRRNPISFSGKQTKKLFASYIGVQYTF